MQEIFYGRECTEEASKHTEDSQLRKQIAVARRIGVKAGQLALQKILDFVFGFLALFIAPVPSVGVISFFHATNVSRRCARHVHVIDQGEILNLREFRVKATVYYCMQMPSTLRSLS
jgi:hypothetical protein